MSDNVAILDGYTKEVVLQYIPSPNIVLYLLVKPEQDLKGTFKAWRCDLEEYVTIKDGSSFKIADLICDLCCNPIIKELYVTTKDKDGKEHHFCDAICRQEYIKTKMSHWHQDNPLDQFVTIMQSLEGKILNLDDGIVSTVDIQREIQELKELSYWLDNEW